MAISDNLAMKYSKVYKRHRFPG